MVLILACKWGLFDGAGGSRNYVATYLLLRRDAPIATSWRTDCYVGTQQMLRRDVISAAPGKRSRLPWGVVIGDNKWQ